MFKYRDEQTAKKILAAIKDMGVKGRFMHICGTHQDTIVRFGLKPLMDDAGIAVHQGPGCPVCVTTSKEIFAMFERFIPWIALLLLLFIGGKMLLDGIRGGDDGENGSAELGVKLLIVQGIATSIDALSTGFTTSAYSAFQAFISSLIIAIVTFVICIAGVKIGKKFGVKLAGKAQILGGVILILIGLKICFIG